MSIHQIKQKLSKVTSELLRPNLGREDKGRLVRAKKHLSERLEAEEQELDDSVDSVHTQAIKDIEQDFESGKHLADEYRKALKKELRVTLKGIEAMTRIRDLVASHQAAIAGLKFSEDNRHIPKTSQHTTYLQHRHIQSSIVSDFFKALGVTFQNIDQYKGFFLSTGAKKDNINELISALDEMKLNDVDVADWYMTYRKPKSNISQDVQAILEEQK